MNGAGSPTRTPTGETHGVRTNGRYSTPRVKVTSRLLPRAIPIARRLFKDSWKEAALSELLEIKNFENWQRALVEAIVTALWVFGSILIITASSQWKHRSLPGLTLLITAFLHFLMFLIYLPTVTGQESPKNGTPFRVHLNPAVTWMLMLRGYSRPVFGLLVMTGQCAGSIIAALAAKELIQDERRDQYLLGGCYNRRTLDGEEVGFSDHQAFLADFLFSFSFLYVSLMVTNPKQLRALGIRFVMFTIAANSGLNIYISAALRKGYSGSMYNPARCLGSAVGYGQPLWDQLWVPFVAPFVAATTAAFLGYIIPPDYPEQNAEKRDIFSRIHRSLAAKGDLEAQKSEPELENNTVYDVPSAARRLSGTPQTPA